MDLWGKNTEIDFFTKALAIASPEQLFYVSKDSRYYAYWPKSYKEEQSTLQSRNSYIGDYTEKWSQNILSSIARELRLYAVKGAVCDELELTQKSAADVALCKTPSVVQKAEDIFALFEVKMSVVWNWEYKKEKAGFKLDPLGDYTTHKGTPGLIRSDSMLKAIGKSINIRTASRSAAKIPIIVLGNTPIQKSYYPKVDNLKKYGIIQGFWSLNPFPLDNNKTSVKRTPDGGFLKFDSYPEFKGELMKLLSSDMMFFAGMHSKRELGRLIEVADKENTYEKKAEKFLGMIN